MKCPHCGQEHPDGYKFCPLTAKTLTPQLKACTNERCEEFGKYTLPLDAIFCPCCGELIGILGEETHSREFYITMAEVLNKISTSLLSLSDDKMVELGKWIKSAEFDWDCWCSIHKKEPANGKVTKVKVLTSAYSKCLELGLTI